MRRDNLVRGSRFLVSGFELLDFWIASLSLPGMNQFTATFLWLAGTGVMAFLVSEIGLPQALRTAVVLMASFVLGWVVFSRVRGASSDRSSKE
jgi:hypothetical protein